MKAVLFDLDGVIADTATYHFTAWRNLIQEHFQVNLPDELEEKTKGVSREDSLRIILDYLGKHVSPEEFLALTAEKNAAYVAALEELSPRHILPGIATLIADLRKHGIALCLASASKNGPIILEKLGLSDAFDAIVNPEEIGAGKPAPDIFISAAKKLQLDPADCVGIEDSVAGVTAINRAGCLSIGIGGTELNHADYRFAGSNEVTYAAIQKIWEAHQQKC